MAAQRSTAASRSAPSAVRSGRLRGAAPALAAVSVVCTLGEIVYAGSATALVTHLAPAHALACFQLSTGFGLAVSPAVITTLAARGPAALWGTLAAAALLSAAAVATE